MNNLLRRICSLISLARSINDYDPLTILLSGLPGSGKRLLLKHVSSKTNLSVLFFDSLDIWSDVPGTCEAKLHAAFQKGHADIQTAN